MGGLILEVEVGDGRTAASVCPLKLDGCEAQSVLIIAADGQKNVVARRTTTPREHCGEHHQKRLRTAENSVSVTIHRQSIDFFFHSIICGFQLLRIFCFSFVVSDGERRVWGFLECWSRKRSKLRCRINNRFIDK